MEAILRTYDNLIYDNWPNKINNGSGTMVPAVFTDLITGWFYGDREVLPEEFPAIVIDAESVNIEWSAIHTLEFEWQWDVMLFIRSDNHDNDLRVMNEMHRLFRVAALPLSHFWVFERCYIDGQIFFDPQYLIDLNTDPGPFQGILDPYLTQVQNRHNGWWNAAHQDYAGMVGSGPVPPTPRLQDLYMSAYLLMFTDDPLTDPWVDFNITYTPRYSGTPITTTPRAFITSYREEGVEPVRFIGDSRVRSSSWGFVQKGTAFLRGIQNTIFGKEQRGMSVFGPR